MLFFWEGINCVLPENVYISSKRKKHSICLWKVYFLSSLCVQESEFTSRAEGDTHCNILVSGSFWIKCGTVMMKRFPVCRICVPVKSSSYTFLRNFKVRGNFVLNHLKCRTTIWVLRDKMSSFVPAYPFCSTIAL
jgi:hypothetical protein